MPITLLYKGILRLIEPICKCHISQVDEERFTKYESGWGKYWYFPVCTLHILFLLCVFVLHGSKGETLISESLELG